MSVLRKIRSYFHSDWCENCTTKMNVTRKALFMLPMQVGHYVSHNNASYYLKNLTKVERKSDICVGYYACGIREFTCPNCNNKLVSLEIFLPVRDQEKYEETIYFKNGELNEIINKI